MFNWYDGERQVQQHKDAARVAGKHYAYQQPTGQQRHRSLLGRFRDFAGRRLIGWGQRLERESATGYTSDPSYDGR